jgi:hypothetical protein
VLGILPVRSEHPSFTKAIGWQYPDHGLRLPNIIHRLGTGGLDCPVPAATNAKMLRRPSKCEC